MKRNKVSVITFCHRDYPVNYGQTLQGFAMYKIIQQMGYDVTIISHKIRDENTKKRYKKNYYFPDKKTIESRSFYKFTKFVKKNMKCLQCYNNHQLEQLVKKSDILIAGSDAIWRTMHYDPAYYLDIKGTEDKLKISYAASFVNYIPEDDNIYIQMVKKICNIDYISTREKKGEEILKRYGCTRSYTVLDPTLLFGQENWSRYIIDMELPKKYILMYLFDDTSEYNPIINEIKKKHNTERVLSIYTYNKLDEREYIVEGVGVDEFITLIKGAEAVITNSFHGTAFSLMFRKEIYILKRKNQSLANDFRFENLAEICGISNRIIDDFGEVEGLAKMDYLYIDEKIEIERKKSMSFLEGAMCDVEDRKCTIR